ncbi:hypothetical protein [Nocardia sp. CS682]|uniref:hypothetical protein n=1 Tax=Nocardia sp. CS682 TaxID=1047172 RepID=UPI001074A544|nr:hypothetical protein [Nocardia sp. CS682]
MRIFAPLGVGGARAPLTTDGRVWAATFAVVAGAAMLALLLLIEGAQPAGTGTHRRLRLLCGVAVVSAVVLRVVMWLPGPDLPPSSDFLNAYGGDARVVVYELVFAAWLGLPLGALGTFVFRFQRGVTRWCTFAGCLAGVGWAVWKVAGVAVRFITGDVIPLASPVSVATGVTSLALVVGGLVSGQLRDAVRQARENREYALARRADDERHCTPAPDSTDTPAA